MKPQDNNNTYPKVGTGSANLAKLSTLIAQSPIKSSNVPNSLPPTSIISDKYGASSTTTSYARPAQSKPAVDMSASKPANYPRIISA